MFECHEILLDIDPFYQKAYNNLLVTRYWHSPFPGLGPPVDRVQERGVREGQVRRVPGEFGRRAGYHTAVAGK